MRRLLLATLILVTGTGCDIGFHNEKGPATVRLTGRVTTSDGRPAAGARVLVELRQGYGPGGPAEDGCMPASSGQGGAGGAVADAAGRYALTTQVRLLEPFEACVFVRAALPEQPVASAPAVAGPRLRWPASDARINAVVDAVVASAAPAP